LFGIAFSGARPVQCVAMTSDHIWDDEMERYCLGKVKKEAELAPIEEHLLVCESCVERVEKAQRYVDTMQVALDRLNRE
jgi:hypothetical protein